MRTLQQAARFYPGGGGILRWHRDGKEIGSVGYSVEGLDNYPLLLHLEYTVTKADGSREAVKCPVEIDVTCCHFGRQREWFTCPLIVDGRACRRRCRILYLAPRATYFGCRECHRLTYPCRRRHRDFLYETIEKHRDALKRIEAFQPPRSPAAWMRRYRRIKAAQDGEMAAWSHIDTSNLAGVSANGLIRMDELLQRLVDRP